MTGDATPANARGTGLHIDLVPVTEVDRAEAERLLLAADEMPELGGALPPLGGGPPYGPPLMVRNRHTGAPAGAVTVVEMTGYPGVASVSMYMLTGTLAIGGVRVAGQAYVLGVDHAFAHGARIVHHEVFAFNTSMLEVLHHLEVPEVARLRRHAYAAGRLWDIVVFAFDAARWEAMHTQRPRLSRMLRGGSAAAG